MSRMGSLVPKYSYVYLTKKDFLNDQIAAFDAYCESKITRAKSNWLSYFGQQRTKGLNNKQIKLLDQVEKDLILNPNSIKPYLKNNKNKIFTSGSQTGASFLYKNAKGQMKTASSFQQISTNANDQLVKSIQAMADEGKRYLETLANVCNTIKQNYDNYAWAALDQAIQNNIYRIGQSGYNRKTVLGDVMAQAEALIVKKEGQGIKLPNYNETAVLYAEQALKSLWDKSKMSAVTRVNAEEIARALAGNISNIGGITAERVVEAGINKALADGLVKGAKGATKPMGNVSMSLGPAFKAMEAVTNTQTFKATTSTTDVMATVTKKGVSIDLTFSVKATSNESVNENGLVYFAFKSKQTNLGQIMFSYMGGVTAQDTFMLANGLAEDTTMTNYRRGHAYQQAKAVVSAVGAGFALAGAGLNNGGEAKYLVANGTIYPMYLVIQNLLQGSGKLNSQLAEIANVGNDKIGDRNNIAQALQRSQQVMNSIYSTAVTLNANVRELGL